MTFTLIPTKDLAASLRAYEALGLTMLWQPGGESYLLGKDGLAWVLLEDNQAEHKFGQGPVWVVEDVKAFRQYNVNWKIFPVPTAIGQYAAFEVEGMVVRVLDLTLCPGERKSLFGAPLLAPPAP